MLFTYHLPFPNNKRKNEGLILFTLLAKHGFEGTRRIPSMIILFTITNFSPCYLFVVAFPVSSSTIAASSNSTLTFI